MEALARRMRGVAAPFARLGQGLDERRSNITALGFSAAVLAVVILTTGVREPGEYTAGIVSGCVLALQVVGMVLVFRSGRIVNFAQLQLGVVAGQLFFVFIERRQLILWTRQLCPGCVPLPHGGDAILRANPTLAAQLGSQTKVDELAAFLAPHWMQLTNSWLSVLLAMLVGALLSLGLSFLVRSFTNAPRLVVTVVTIAAGIVAVTAGNWLVSHFTPKKGHLLDPGVEQFRLRPNITQPIGALVFHTADLIAPVLLAVVAGGIAVFLRRNRLGVAMRASSDNAERAQTLGMSVGAVTSVAWTLAGALSALATLITVMRTAQQPGGDLPLVFLELALAALAIGGMTSIGYAVAGCLLLSLTRELVVARFGTDAAATGVMLLVLLVVLLLRRPGRARGDFDAEGVWTAATQIRPTPTELRHLVQVRRTRIAFALLLVGLVLGLPYLLSAGQLVVATTAVASVMILLSVLVLTGWAGQISLGQVAFAGVGGYVTVLVHSSMPVSLLAGALAGALFATVVGLPALRLRGLYLAVVTLAVSLAVSGLLLDPRYLGSHVTGTLKRPVFLALDFEADRAFYFLTVCVVGLATLAVLGLRNGRTARALLACKDNEAAAQAFGMSLLRVRLSAFAVSGFLAALAGGLQVYALRGMHPTAFEPAAGIAAFLYAVLGGLGSLAGPFLGVAYSYLGTITSGSSFGPLLSIVLSPGLAVILLLHSAPGGLAQVVFGLRDAWLRRLAIRHRIDVPALLGYRQTRGKVPLAVLLPEDNFGSTEVARWYRPQGQWLIDPDTEAARDRAEEPELVR